MKFKENANYLSTGVSWVFTIAQTKEVLQCVCFVLSAVATAFTIAYTVWRWYNNAKKDGKITITEVKDLKDQVTDEVDKFYQNLPKKEDK